MRHQPRSHGPADRRAHPARGRLNEEPPGELSFEDEEPSRRAGDPRPAASEREEFPRKRVREAGQTGGARPDGDVTADDLAPETLLDEDRSRTPSARAARQASDTALSVVDESAIGSGRTEDEQSPRPRRGEQRPQDPADGRPREAHEHRRKRVRRDQWGRKR